MRLFRFAATPPPTSNSPPPSFPRPSPRARTQSHAGVFALSLCPLCVSCSVLRIQFSVFRFGSLLTVSRSQCFQGGLRTEVSLHCFLFSICYFRLRGKAIRPSRVRCSP